MKSISYKNKKLYDFSDLFLTQVIDDWHSSFLSENQCRELARNEPWKSIWITREKSGVPLIAPLFWYLGNQVQGQTT